MIMDNDILKWDSQWPILIHMLVMLTILIIYLLSLVIALKCFQEIQYSLGVDESFYLLMVLLTSSFKKDNHSEVIFDGSLSKMLRLTWQFCVELNIWYNICQRLLISIQGYPLNWSASIASSLCFLTQFIRSQSLWFFEVISWILSSKNNLLIFLTTSLKDFQSTINFKNL